MKPLPTAKHPARFSKAILDTMRPIIDRFGLPVHDPFAGTGERLGRLCDELGVVYTGGDIEDWQGDKRVRLADATHGVSYPNEDVLIVTSPVYPNGVADHFVPKESSKRYTYRNAIGHDLDVNNAGRYSIRGGRKAERTYWDIQRRAVRHWRGPCCVNVSDFIFGGTIYPLVQHWDHLLRDHGFEVFIGYVATPRMRNGANAKLRVAAEAILIGLPVPVPTDEESARATGRLSFRDPSEQSVPDFITPLGHHIYEAWKDEILRQIDTPFILNLPRQHGRTIAAEWLKITDRYGTKPRIDPHSAWR